MAMIDKIKEELKKNSTITDEKGCHRIFHGRGKAFGEEFDFNIDFFDGFVLISAYSELSDSEQENLVDAIAEAYPHKIKSIALQQRKREKGNDFKFFGPSAEEYVVSENGLKFKINLSGNQNVGLFLDSQPVREYIMNNSKNKKVLNLFSYTCSNSVYAESGGAESIINIDLSRPCLTIGRENHRLNDLTSKSIEFQSWNVLKSFNGIKKKGPFDLIVIDPPTDQGASFKAKRDYPKIIKKLNDWLAPGGEALLCLNDPLASENQLSQWVTENSDSLSFKERLSPPESISRGEEKPRPYFEIYIKG
jgi:23S rRNA (cytosine1962-C5)-methyltransferase